MLIGIDGNEANIKNRVGVGQFAYNLLSQLYKIDTKNEYIIYLKEQPLDDMPKDKNNWQYRVFGPKKLWTKLALPIKLYTQKEKLKLFFSPSHYSPEFSPFPTIVTIHDLGYLEFQEQFTKKDLYQLINWTKTSIKKSKHIIAVSEFTKKELQNIYSVNPKKITVAYNGVDNPPVISKTDTQTTLQKFNLNNQEYFLYLGTLKPNKNIPFLLEAFAQYLKEQKTQTKLIIAGKKGWLFDDIFNTVKNLKIESSVIFTDYITETEKWVLYKNAKVLILPSLYEGFGIPAIEAQKIGTSVIASNIPVLKEILGNSAIFIDPHNTSTLVEAFKKINNLKSINQNLNNYTWENTAKSVLNVFDKMN